MEAKRTVKLTAKNGAEVEVKITRTREVAEQINFSDGWNVSVGEKTTDRLVIEASVDGKNFVRTLHAPVMIDPITCGNYDKLTGKGIYARLGDTYISKAQYDLIMAALDEIDAELGQDEEYSKLEAKEQARKEAGLRRIEEEGAEYERKIKSGWCPKCGSYCYGDCKAN